MERVPDRVSVDLRQHQAAQELRTAESPDFAQTDDYHGIVCADLASPLAKLFNTRDQILQLQRSEAFRTVLDKEKSIAWLLRDLSALERSLYQAWSEA